MPLARKLRAVIKNISEAKFSRERSALITDALPLMQRAADALDAEPGLQSKTPIDPDLAKLISALGKGSVFPGRLYYINRPKEFDEAAQALIDKFHFEEIIGQ